MKPEDFTPALLTPGFGIVLVATSTCSNCKRTMMRTGKGADFPAFWRAGRRAQMQRANWGEVAYETSSSNLALCTDCVPAAAAFKCALCERDRCGAAERSYGYPAEHLCTTCYETVPAKVWHDKDSELEDKHRYDFE